MYKNKVKFLLYCLLTFPLAIVANAISTKQAISALLRKNCKEKQENQSAIKPN